MINDYVRVEKHTSFDFENTYLVGQIAPSRTLNILIRLLGDSQKLFIRNLSKADEIRTWIRVTKFAFYLDNCYN